MLFLIFIAILLLVVGLIWYYKLSVKAEVKVEIKPTLEKELYLSHRESEKILNDFEEFNNRDNPQYKLRKLFEARKREIEERAELRLKGIILDDQAAYLQRLGYTLREVTPTASKYRQWVILREPVPTP